MSSYILGLLTADLMGFYRQNFKKDYLLLSFLWIPIMRYVIAPNYIYRKKNEGTLTKIVCKINKKM